MPASAIKCHDRSLRLYKCAIDPDLTTRTILVQDQWDYVTMWLQRHNISDSLFFWRQAEAFSRASADLPKVSSPLTRYYAALNACKAMLLAKGRPLAPYHGVTGESASGIASLANETVRLKGSGTLSELCRYMGESVNQEVYNLDDILYNLPYIHRAYTITFPGKEELFIPIADPMFVRVDGTSESYFRFKVVDRLYQTPQTLATIVAYERDIGITDAFIVRRRNRFRWRDGDSLAMNELRFKNYYRSIRRATYYIKGSSRLWYVKKDSKTVHHINRSSLTLTYMAFHRLSELARYTPDALSRHFDSQHNWLLSEFIGLALNQFIDEIAAEITGHEFMPPGVASR